MEEPYDKIDAGERLRKKRTLLGLSQNYTAMKTGISEKHYADIERGTVGMSVASLLSLSKLLDMPVEYIVYGTLPENAPSQTEETSVAISLIQNGSARFQHTAVALIRALFHDYLEKEEPDSPSQN